MHNPCLECSIRRGVTYTEECDDTCMFANIVKSKNEQINELDRKLRQAYHVIGQVVDKPNPFATEPYIDRNTALSVLKEFSRDMYPSYDLFGRKTLVMRREQFEDIREKYLDKR